MDVQLQKACLIQEHDNNLMVSMCLDNKCLKKSRSICQKCFLESEYHHKDCNTFVEFDGQQNDQLKLYYKNELFDMKKAWEFINEYEVEQQKSVDEKIDNLVQDVTQSIRMIGKSLKIQVLEKYSGIKEKIKENLRNLNDFEDLRDLQEKFSQFKQGCQTIEDLNIKLKEKQEQHINLDSFNQCKKDFEEIEQKGVIYDSYFFDLQKNINLIIKKYINISQLQLEDKTHINIIPFSNYHQYDGFNKSLSTIELKQIPILQFRSEKSFKKETDFHLQFQIKFDISKDSQHFGIGVIPAEIIQNNLLKENDKYLYNIIGVSFNSRNCRQLGNKTLKQVFKTGQIYDLKIQYEKNMFTIQDKDRKALAEYENQFDQQYDEWYFFLQIPQGFSFRQINY